MTDGTLETIDGRPALRFERTLAHPVERVWRAVSEPAELERWFPAAADWTPAKGETFEAYGATGEVTEVDAPHRLAWTFGSERYSFELAAQDDGCRLVFTHDFDDREPPRRRRPAGTPTSRGSSLISTAATSPRRRPTSLGKRCTSATPSASGSTRRRDGASGRSTAPVNPDRLGPLPGAIGSGEICRDRTASAAYGRTGPAPGRRPPPGRPRRAGSPARTGGRGVLLGLLGRQLDRLPGLASAASGRRCAADVADPHLIPPVATTALIAPPA